MGVVVRGLGAVGAVLVLAGSADAQRRERLPGHFAIGFIAADPLGDLKLFFDEGFGLQIEGAIPISDDGRVRIRADLGVIVYGEETRAACYAPPIGCRIGLELTTENNIYFGGLGPELVLLTGRLQPYVNGTLGFSSFVTTSFLDDGSGIYPSTTNFSHTGLAWKLGGGLRLRVNRGRRPISLDFGLERHENGVADFLTKGDIIDNPDGSITILPNRSEADLLTFRLGVTIGVGIGPAR